MRFYKSRLFSLFLSLCILVCNLSWHCAAASVKDIFATASSSFTLLVYMIGSDLESEGGCASDDLREICNATAGSGLNIVIQTGGAQRWYHPSVSNGTNRFLVKNHKLTLLEHPSKRSMADPDTLGSFIQWGVSAYPADRYGLILWNHGGGSLAGFGYDELFPDDALTLSDLSYALRKGNTHFSFVGFDACLMATLETALTFSPYADYLIASEESESAKGWYYTDWLSSLAAEPALSIPVLGKQIVDDFASHSGKTYYTEYSLSLLDLSTVSTLYQALCTYFGNAGSLLSGQSSRFASIRSQVKEYGEGEYEQIDLMHYLELTAPLSIGGQSEAVSALQRTVLYQKTNLSHTSGLALYFPYRYPWYYPQMRDELAEIGMKDSRYQTFFDKFSSAIFSAKEEESSIKTAVEQLTGYNDPVSNFDYQDEEWYDSSYDLSSPLANAAFPLLDKGGYFAFGLTEQELESIATIEQDLFLDDGEGYLDLGRDALYDFDRDGDLIIDTSGGWLTLNDYTVCFYNISDNNKYSYGYVPVELNYDTDIELIICWDANHPSGYIAGYRPAEPNDQEPHQSTRGLFQLTNEDVITGYCDYYTYDGEFEASYYITDPLPVKDGISVEYEYIPEGILQISYRITDIYGNVFWTPTFEATLSD